MLTEAIHTPFISDRYLSIANSRYIFKNARHLSEEISLIAGGRIQKRAEYLLDEACTMLQEIERIGLETAMEQGMFADIKRSRDGGKGSSGVIVKHKHYYNPFFDLFLNHLTLCRL